MTNQGKPKIGIQCNPTVPLTQRHNVDLIERGNDGVDNPVLPAASSGKRKFDG